MYSVRVRVRVRVLHTQGKRGVRRSHLAAESPEVAIGRSLRPALRAAPPPAARPAPAPRGVGHAVTSEEPALYTHGEDTG